MNKKSILTKISLIAAVSFSLVACSEKINQEIVTMKNGTITIQDFFNEVKSEPNTQFILRNMIISKVFNDKYGNSIEKKYKEKISQYDDKFWEHLKNIGMNETEYKKRLKSQLALESGLRKHLSITKKDLESAKKSFHPKVKVQIIKTNSKEKAIKLREKVKNNKNSFTKNSKELSSGVENNFKKFDSTSKSIPKEIKEATWKLKKGEVSEVISIKNESSSMTDFYLIKLIENNDNFENNKQVQKKIRKIAENKQLNNPLFVMQSIKKELKEANVKIKNNDFSNILSVFVENDEKNIKNKS